MHATISTGSNESQNPQALEPSSDVPKTRYQEAVAQLKQLGLKTVTQI